MKRLKSRKPNRLKGYDYSGAGGYFITVCVQDRQTILGKIENNKMVLNNIGNMVDYWWHETFNKFKNASIDEYIIMPNHIHGIINIVGAGSPCPDNDINDVSNNKGRGNRAPTLGQIIAYFKYQSTKQINLLNNSPGVKIWQRSFHDHIIRDDKTLNKIREYITSNPVNWENDIDNIMKRK